MKKKLIHNTPFEASPRVMLGPGGRAKDPKDKFLPRRAPGSDTRPLSIEEGRIKLLNFQDPNSEKQRSKQPKCANHLYKQTNMAARQLKKNIKI